jgi:hypothetical protein
LTRQSRNIAGVNFLNELIESTGHSKPPHRERAGKNPFSSRLVVLYSSLSPFPNRSAAHSPQILIFCWLSRGFSRFLFLHPEFTTNRSTSLKATKVRFIDREDHHWDDKQTKTIEVMRWPTAFNP